MLAYARPFAAVHLGDEPGATIATVARRSRRAFTYVERGVGTIIEHRIADDAGWRNSRTRVCCAGAANNFGGRLPESPCGMWRSAVIKVGRINTRSLCANVFCVLIITPYRFISLKMRVPRDVRHIVAFDRPKSLRRGKPRTVKNRKIILRAHVVTGE